MKKCECGHNMELTKFVFEYAWVCPECERVEEVNDQEIEDGDF